MSWVAGMGKPGMGAGLKITTLGKPVPVAQVYQDLTGLQFAFKKNNYISNVGFFSNLFIFHTFFLINKLLVTVCVTVLLPYQQPSEYKHDNSNNGQPQLLQPQLEQQPVLIYVVHDWEGIGWQ